MAVEYKFLRFEIVGIATILYTIIIILPLIFDGFKNFLSTDISAAIAFIGSLFIFSIPLGYIMHQLVVNKYRSERRENDIFRIIDLFINEKIKGFKGIKEDEKKFIKKNYNILQGREKNSFLTALMDYFAHTDKSGDAYERIEVRWSHFYARKSVGKYAPLASAPFALLLSIFIIFSTDWIEFETNGIFISLIMSIGFWLIILIFSLFFIDSYSKKILLEIENLEKIIFFSVEKNNIDNILKEMFLNYFLKNNKVQSASPKKVNK